MRLSYLLFSLLLLTVAELCASCSKEQQIRSLFWNIDREAEGTKPHNYIKRAMRMWQESTCLNISTNQQSEISTAGARVYFYKKHGCDKVILKQDSIGLKAIIDVSCIMSLKDAVGYIFNALKLINEACSKQQSLLKHIKFTEGTANPFEVMKEINGAFCTDVCPKKNCNSGFVNPNRCSKCMCPIHMEGENCELEAQPVVCGSNPHLLQNATNSSQTLEVYGRGACVKVIESPEEDFYLYGKITLLNFDGPECNEGHCRCTTNTGKVTISFFDKDGTFQGDQKWCQQDGNQHLLVYRENFDQYHYWQVNFDGHKSKAKMQLDFVALKRPIKIRIDNINDIPFLTPH